MERKKNQKKVLGNDFFNKKQGTNIVELISNLNKYKKDLKKKSNEVNQVKNTLKSAEMALLSIQNRYKAIFDSSVVPVIISKIDGTIVNINKAACKLYGYSKKELIGLNEKILVHPSHNDLAQKFKKEISLKGHFSGESIDKKKDGSKIIVEIRSFRYVYNNDTRLVSIIRDITCEKLAEKKIKQSEERFREMAELLPQIVFEVDNNLNITFINNYGIRLTKYSKIEFKRGLNVSVFFPPKELNLMKNRLKIIQSGNRLPAKEYQLIKKDGSSIPVLVSSSLIIQDGKQIGLRGVAVDITEQKLTEGAFRKSKERLSMAMEAANDGMWDLNLVTDETYFDPRYYTMLGYDPYEFPCSLKEFERHIHPDDLDNTNKLIQETIKGKSKRLCMEYRFKAKNNKYIWILARGKIVKRDKDGKPLRMVGTHTDITLRKEAEERIEASLKEKDTLVKEIHHRVKNNMQIILSLLNLQSSQIKDKTALNLLKNNRDRIKSMALIHERLYKSKNLSKIDFSEYVKTFAQHLLSSYVHKNQVSLKINIRDIFLDIDKSIPCGLLINELVSNALKYAFRYGEKGIIKINIKLNKKDKIKLIIEDDGNRFPTNIDIKKTRTLGLRLVDKLVEQLDGSLKLERNGKTKFTITFPLKNGKEE